MVGAGNDDADDVDEDNLALDVQYLVNHNTAPPSQDEVDGWSITHRMKAPTITMSRFCRPRILGQVADARYKLLPVVQWLVEDGVDGMRL